MEIFLGILIVCFLAILVICFAGIMFFFFDYEVLDGHFKRKIRRWFGVEE